LLPAHTQFTHTHIARLNSLARLPVRAYRVSMRNAQHACLLPLRFWHRCWVTTDSPPHHTCIPRLPRLRVRGSRQRAVLRLVTCHRFHLRAFTHHSYRARLPAPSTAQRRFPIYRARLLPARLRYTVTHALLYTTAHRLSAHSCYRLLHVSTALVSCCW